MKLLIVCYSMYGQYLQNSRGGKVGGIFTSSNTQHGGQKSTVLSSYYSFASWNDN